MLGVYQTFLIGAFVGELIVLFTSLQYVHQFKDIISRYDQGINSPLLPVEDSIESMFDPFFFGASSSCSGNANTHVSNVISLQRHELQSSQPHCMHGSGLGRILTVPLKSTKPTVRAATSTA